jgi:hypothetical protein
MGSVNTLHERKLCSFVSVYRVYSVNTDDILMWICEMYYTIHDSIENGPFLLVIRGRYR